MKTNQSTNEEIMSKHMEIYGDKFGTLFVGVVPEGKVLDVAATERGMQIDLDETMSAWDEEHPEPDREICSEQEYNNWEDNQRYEFDRIGVQFSQDPNWYDSNLVWIDDEPTSKILREHFNRNLSREEVVEILGEEAVNKVESENCDFTNAVSAELDCNNEVEFSATYTIKQEDPEWGFISITAYYYQDKDVVAETEDLGNLDWEVRHFTIQ